MGVYQRYRHLTKSIACHQKEKQEEEEYSRTGLEANREYIHLKKEKKRLQRILTQYQTEFVQKNGRKVQYLEDRAPIQSEYDAYKELRRKILEMEEAQNLIDS